MTNSSPQQTSRQHTIASAVSLDGIGLHTGDPCRLTFLPAPVDSGYRFRRTDLPGKPEVPALAELVTDTSRGTTIARDGAEIHTVEHILSALAGLGIDNAVIEVNNHEPPIMDGSSWPFVRALQRAGLIEQSQPRRYLELTEPLISETDSARMILRPNGTGLHLSFVLHFDHKVLMSQYKEFTLDSERYSEDIAPARTFAFLHEIDLLRKAGLAKGGSLKCAVVIGEKEILNDSLRFPDEFARHKLLDLIGDLTLIGRPLRGEVISIKGGHTANVALALEIRERYGLLEG